MMDAQNLTDSVATQGYVFLIELVLCHFNTFKKNNSMQDSSLSGVKRKGPQSRFLLFS